MRDHDSNRLRSPDLGRPFYLVIVDYDAGRYSLDGPVAEIEVWENKAARLRSAGRSVRCFQTTEQQAKLTADRLRSFQYDRWPLRSIIDPPMDAC